MCLMVEVGRKEEGGKEEEGGIFHSGEQEGGGRQIIGHKASPFNWLLWLCGLVHHGAQ